MFCKLVSLVSRFAETLQSYKQRRSHKTKKIMKHETLEESGRYNYRFVYLLEFSGSGAMHNLSSSSYSLVT